MVDPADPKLKAHFIEQLERKYTEISNFQGMPCIGLWPAHTVQRYRWCTLGTLLSACLSVGLVVDRSDWNTVYNYDFDDGASFIANATAHLSQFVPQVNASSF